MHHNLSHVAFQYVKTVSYVAFMTVKIALCSMALSAWSTILRVVAYVQTE